MRRVAVFFDWFAEIFVGLLFGAYAVAAVGGLALGLYVAAERL